MKLKNTSASQVEAWTNCPRLWHFQWVRGFKAPPTEAQQRGTLIHAANEHLVKTGTLPDNEWAIYAEACRPHLPIGKERVLVEHKMLLDTAPGLPPWLGFIDLLDDSRTLSGMLRITDHKTSSDFRYAKTPEELSQNSQVISYARFAFNEVLSEDEPLVEVGHLYIKTQKEIPKKLPTKGKLVLPVYTQVNRAQVDAVWERDLVKVEEMVRAAEISNTDTLPPTGATNGHCRKYGGCPHLERCGLTKTQTVSQSKQGVDMTSFLSRVKAAQANQKANAGEDDAAPQGNAEKISAAQEAKALPAAQEPKATTSGGSLAARLAASKRASATNQDVEEVKAILAYFDSAGVGTPMISSELAPLIAQARGYTYNGGGGMAGAGELAQESVKTLADLRALKAEVEAMADGGEEQPQQGFRGVVPPDAPPRTTPVAAAAPPTEEPTAPEPKKRGRPPKNKGGEAPVAHAAQPVRTTDPDTGITLYIDCVPIKHEGDVFPTMFEDWINPAIMALNEEAQGKGLADYRLMGFGEKQVFFAKAVGNMLERNPPSVLLLSTTSMHAKDALDVLIPFAKTVVRRV